MVPYVGNPVRVSIPSLQCRRLVFKSQRSIYCTQTHSSTDRKSKPLAFRKSAWCHLQQQQTVLSNLMMRTTTARLFPQEYKIYIFVSWYLAWSFLLCFNNSSLTLFWKLKPLFFATRRLNWMKFYSFKFKVFFSLVLHVECSVYSKKIIFFWHKSSTHYFILFNRTEIYL